MNPSSSGVPRGHQGVSADPPLGDWIRAAERNVEGPSRAHRFGLDPLSARAEAGFPGGLLVLSGHQPVLFHPGLWAKALCATELAARTRGSVLHKITDTDAPGAQDGWIPVRYAVAVREEPVRLSAPGVPYAFQDSPRAADVRKLLERVSSCGRPFCAEAVTAFFPGPSLESRPFVDWNDWHEDGLRSLDGVSNASRGYCRASNLWGLPSFRRFLGLWLREADRFGGAFNRALSRYRRERGVTHPLVPAPDLTESGSWRETPFWTADKGFGRETLWVRTEGKGALLRSGMAGGEWSWEGSPDSLASAPWALWPKALPQTLFARLFLCDFFVHGLGGGAYEPANDCFLEELGEPPPPAYGTVTATLLIDPEAEPRYRDLLESSRKAVAWRRALEKNPEYLLTRRTAWEPDLPESLRSRCVESSARPALRDEALEKAALLEALADPARRGVAGKRIRELNEVMAGHLGELWKAFDAFEKGIGFLSELHGALAFREYAYFCYPPRQYVELRQSLSRRFDQEP
jgi:hypothetical protein